MSDKERLENMSPVGFDLDGNVLLKGEDYHWLIEQAEHRQKLLERLNKRGIEIKKLKNQLSCCREKIKKSEWSRLVLKGTAEQVMRSSRSNYELANKLKAENKRLREALEFYADSKNWLPQNDGVLSEITMDYGSKAQQALEGDND
jgi:hypothetical protein